MSIEIQNKDTYQFSKATIRDIDVSGKRILLRVDYNVPRDKAGGFLI